MTSPDLPRLDGVRAPTRFLLFSPLRPLARWVFRRRFSVSVHGAHHVPPRGAVIFASNHIGVVDGPVLAIFGPRPVHALTKIEMFTGFMRPFLLASGQIPLDRDHTDPRAVKISLAALRRGSPIGIYPEGTRGSGDLSTFHLGAAYFALVSGAPVVPVSMFGTRAPGAPSSALPPQGGAADMVFGSPFVLDAVPWPRRKEDVARASALLQEHMRAELIRARDLVGRELPGPLPFGDSENEPLMGHTDQGVA